MFKFLQQFFQLSTGPICLFEYLQKVHDRFLLNRVFKNSGVERG